MGEVTSRTLRTERYATRAVEAGEGEPIVLVHGNLSDAAVWGEQLAALPDGVRGIAPDLRGYGEAEPLPVDATRGLRDFADDVRAVLDALEVEAAHLVGHSLGGGVVAQVAIDAPERVRSLVLVAPVSPYGFGGTRADGTPCTDDFAGSGAGGANPDLVRLLSEGDRSTDDPVSPRNVIRTLFFPTPEAVRDEDLILDGMLASRIGDDHYPGDSTASPNWPGLAPGTRGVLNALSPRYCHLTALADGRLDVPVLWVRGDKDAIVSDTSMVDLGHLGAIGLVPGWPGEHTSPAQPMVHQTRAVLDRYAEAGGGYREVVMEDTGHFAFTQRPDEFAKLLQAHLEPAG